MVKALTKVSYKPNTQSTEEFIVIVNGSEYKKWKEGDTWAKTQEAISIPLADVVDSFKIFHSVTGNQGRLGEASKQQLENVFGTSKDIDVVEKLLKEGTAHAADRLDDTHITKNYSTGDPYRMDTRGSGARTTGA